jgi:hypothetical protein
LPNIRVEGKDFSFKDKAELEAYLIDEVHALFPSFLEIDIEEQLVKIPTHDLTVAINTDQTVDYGKGANILEVIGQGFDLADGKNIQLSEISFSINPEEITEYFPFFTSDPDTSASVLDSTLRNCGRGKFQLNFNNQKIQDTVTDAMQSKARVVWDISEIVTDPGQVALIQDCKKVVEKYQELNMLLNVQKSPVEWDSMILAERGSNNSLSYAINSTGDFSRLVENFGKSQEIALDEGEYNQHGNKAYVVKMPQTGKRFDYQITAVKKIASQPKSGVY